MLLLNRRAAFGGLAAVGTLVAMPRVLRAQAAGPFKLTPLPYAANALEPHIDAKTMELHHGKHHAKYVETLNEALKDHGELARRPLHEILARLSEVPEAIRTTVRNNAGGHANHTMFWQIMGASKKENVGQGGRAAIAGPDGEIDQAITRDFGGLEKLQAAFTTAGEKLFGSGWVFVTVARDGKLAVETKPNQDTPLMEGKHVLLSNDVWEHAYYLTYQNRRVDYLKAWWNVVDWDKIGERYAAAKAGKLTI